MIVKVLFFGRLRELLELDSKILTILEDDYSIQDLVNYLKETYPILNEHKFVVSLNKNYVFDYDEDLHNNDELALIPPISGG